MTAHSRNLSPIEVVAGLAVGLGVIGLLMWLTSSSAETVQGYDPARVKAGITDYPEVFAVERWESTDAGGWMARVDNTVISVHDDNAGIIAALEDSAAGVLAMLQCRTLAQIAMGLEEGEAMERVSALVVDAARNAEQQRDHTLTERGIAFTVSPKQLGNVVVLGCTVKPAQ